MKILKRFSFIILIVNIIFVSNSLAVQIKITRPCSNELTIDSNYSIPGSQKLGDVTVMFLNSKNISYEGSASGILSIFNTPVGVDAYEVISDNQMNAYGWCYSINGLAPELMPDQVDVHENDEILWWYGYATYKNGAWITQCTPSVERSSSKFCKNIH